MKFDLHCHTKEGSIDSKVSVREFADRFIELGYDGFMIADHNSYRGCRAWDVIKDEPKYRSFTVIRGIEYDTKDAGHVLIIMPDDVYLGIFRIRGMRLRKTIKLVHKFGGIIGLAHPFGAAGSSAMGFKLMDMDLIAQLDFIETFNTCESPLSNELAKALADKYELPGFAGSDSHVTDYIGMAATIVNVADFSAGFNGLTAQINCNNDLIAVVQQSNATSANTPVAPLFTAAGTERKETKKAKRKEHWTGVLGFKIYNRGIGKLVCPYRKYRHHRLLKAF